MSFFFLKYSFFFSFSFSIHTSSEQWNLPESCIIPWQELLNNDENDQIPENDDIDSLMLQIDEKKSSNRVSTFCIAVCLKRLKNKRFFQLFFSNRAERVLKGRLRSEEKYFQRKSCNRNNSNDLGTQNQVFGYHMPSFPKIGLKDIHAKK